MASGIEKGTLYRRTEEMLQNYRAMKARVAILERELATITDGGVTETQEEAIEGIYYARVVNGMPMGTEITDKTANVADVWRERYQKDFHRMWRNYVLERQGKNDELHIWREYLQKIDIAIGSLRQKERDVVNLFYIHGMKWEDVGKRLNYAHGHCKKIRERAVWYMSLSLFPRKVY